MGRYATRERDLDRLLRAERCVDLPIVRRSLRAVSGTIPQDLEPFLARTVGLRDAAGRNAAVKLISGLGERESTGIA
jgi:hypothetical protein